jgi:hypothetical protein
VLSHLSSASLPVLPLCRALADHLGHLVPEVAAQAGCLVHRRLVSPAAATHHVIALARLPSHDPPMRRNLSYGCLTFCAFAAHDGERTPLQEGISRTTASITSTICVFRVYVPLVGVTDRDPYGPGRLPGNVQADQTSEPDCDLNGQMAGRVGALPSPGPGVLRAPGCGCRATLPARFVPLVALAHGAPLQTLRWCAANARYWSGSAGCS